MFLGDKNHFLNMKKHEEGVFSQPALRKNKI